MRICIFGAGAVGSFLAARLAQAGRDVSVVARGPHLAAIQRDGLRLQALDGEMTVRLPAAEDPAALGAQDLVIVSLKTPALAQAAATMAPLLHAETAVAFALNGIFWFYGDGFAPQGTTPDTARLDRDGTLHRLIGARRSLGMVVLSPNTLVAPGVVRNDRTGNAFVLGEALADRRDRAPSLAALLDNPGFACRATTDIRREMWLKLIRNAASSPICCLTGLTVAQAYGDPAVRALAVALMRETLAVAVAHGFTELPADPPSDIQSGLALHHKPSMLQDLELGRAMEIDSQLAILQDLARQAGVATPVTDTLLPLVIARARAAGSYPGR